MSANHSSTPSTPAASPDVSAQLAATMAKLVELQEQQAARREPTFDEWLAKQPKRNLPFPLYMNGIQISASQVTDEQLALLPALKVGRFFDRKIHVWRDSSPDRGVHVDWPRKDMSDRMAITAYGRDFTEILQKLTTEAPDLT